MNPKLKNMLVAEPLTLPLSLREREQLSAVVFITDDWRRHSDSNFLNSLRTILPLPRGEGRGEGEGRIRTKRPQSHPAF